MRRVLAAAVAALAAAAAANVATAGTIAVGGACTLADAITAANWDFAEGGCPAGSGADTISLEPAATYTLSAVEDYGDGPNGLPTVFTKITIEGNGATIERSTAPGTPDFRLLNLDGAGTVAELRLRSLTLRNGRVASWYPGATPCAGGAGIRAEDAVLELVRVTVTGNEVYAAASCYGGGGILALGGAVSIRESTISGNRSAAGGGGGDFRGGGRLDVVDSAIAGNRAENASESDVAGGGLTTGVTTFISGSTISGNVAERAGGLFVLSFAFLINSTVSGNRATGTEDSNGPNAGGIDAAHGDVRVIRSTITDNEAPAGAGAGGGLLYTDELNSARLWNTIVAGNRLGGSAVSPRADCAVPGVGNPWQKLGNLFGIGTGCPQGLAFNRYVAPADVTSAVLAPLALNAPGTTQTHALLPGSPALDGGDWGICDLYVEVDVDQRGVARPTVCDIGAYESDELPPPAPGDVVARVVQGSVSTPPFPAAPITLGLSGLLGDASVPLELLDLSLASACSRLQPGDPCRELALAQSVRCRLQPGDPCREARVETACARFIPGDPCVEGNQAVDLFVELRRHPDGGAAPVLQPATLANATATGFEVVYDAVLPGIAATRQTLRFAIGAGQPLRFANVQVGAPQSPRFHVTFELERTGGAAVAGPLWTVVPSGTVAPPPPDTTPPQLTVPAGVVADATSPAGAAVGYVVSATDAEDADPTIACVPASGSVFAVGTTTVACTASDDAGNDATATFVVRVRGAAEQLVALVDRTLAYVDQPALGATLRQQLEAAVAALVAKRKSTACGALALYQTAVRLAPTRLLTAAEKAELTAEATRIRTAIGC